MEVRALEQVEPQTGATTPSEAETRALTHAACGDRAPRAATVGGMRTMLLATFVLLATACGPDTTWRPAYDADPEGWVMHAWALPGMSLVTAGGSPAAGRINFIEDGEVIPQAIPDVPLMNWIHGFAPNDIFAVGFEGTILHYDGAAWTQMSVPTTQDLWGIWGASRDDLWAVGGTARRPDVGVPTLLHFDGAAWTEQTVPSLTPVNVSALFKLWGSGPSDIYAVGARGAVVHYDGSAWSEVVVGAQGGFSAIWGSGPDNILLVGGLSNGHLSHWNGTEWRSVDVTPLPGLNGVWTRSADVAHIVGVNGFVGTVDLQTLEITEETARTGEQFHAAYGVDGRLYAVGGNLANPGTSFGVAFVRDLGDDE